MKSKSTGLKSTVSCALAMTLVLNSPLSEVSAETTEDLETQEISMGNLEQESTDFIKESEDIGVVKKKLKHLKKLKQKRRVQNIKKQRYLKEQKKHQSRQN